MDQQQTKVNLNRMNNYNMIGFVSALMVVLGHMCHLIGIPPTLFMGQAVSTLAVKILFVISGCLTATSYMRDRNVIRYGIRRISRILPGLIGVVLFSILIIGPIFSSLDTIDYFKHDVTWGYLKNILFNVQYFLPGVFSNNPYPDAVNGSLWTLPVQMGLYIMLPIVFTIFRQFDKIKVSFMIAILLEGVNIILSRFFPEIRIVIWGTDIISALTIMPYFFMGIVFTSSKIKKYLNLQLGIGLVLVSAMLNFAPAKTELLVFLILPYFVFSFALAEKPFFGKWFSRNDFSYGMYLYGFVLQQAIVTILWKYQLTLNIYWVISSIITVVFGMLSWFCIERPFQQLGKKLLSNEKIKNLPQQEMRVVE